MLSVSANSSKLYYPNKPTYCKTAFKFRHENNLRKTCYFFYKIKIKKAKNITLSEHSLSPIEKL